MHGKVFAGLTRRSLTVLIGMAVLTLAAAFAAAWWLGYRADWRMRNQILAQAAAIANTIDTERIKTLTFTEADKDNPVFQRLSLRMRAYAGALGLRSLFSMALRDGNLVFGPESLLEGDPYASPPGTVYKEPSSLDFEIFRTGRGMIQGPDSDEYGTFVTASAPVVDPRTGAVVMVIGIDVEAKDWGASVNRARMGVLPFTLGLLAINLAGGISISRRNRLGAGSHGRKRYAEAVVCAAIGLTLTLAGALLAHDAESRSREESFSVLARALASHVAEGFRDLRSHLEGLARFFGGSAFVDREEFLGYAGPFTECGISIGWFWIPRVPADAVPREFLIWQKDERGARRPVSGREAYYPALYVVPQAGGERILGFDMGSESLQRGAMAEAAVFGTPVATDPVTLDEAAEAPAGVFVFQQAGKGIQQGFVAAALSLDSRIMLPMRRSGGLESGVTAGLFQLEAGRPPRFLASSLDGHHGDLCWGSGNADFLTVFPLFCFEKAYALVFHRENEWMAAHAMRNAWFMAIGGLLITAAITLLMAFLANQQADLERQVQARTASLQESEEKFALAFRMSPYAIAISRLHDGRLIEVNDAFVTITGFSRDEALGSSTLELRLWADEKDRNEFMKVLLQGGRIVGREFPFRTKTGEIVAGLVSADIIMLKGDPCVLSSIEDITDRKRAEEERERLQGQLIQAQKMESVGRLAGGVAHDFNNMLGVILGHAEMAKDQLDPSHPVREDLREIREAARRSAELTRQLLAFARKQIARPRPLDLNDTVSIMLKMLRRLIGEDIELIWKPGANLWTIKMDPAQVDQILANLAVNARDAIAGVGTVTIGTENAVLDGAYCSAHAGAVPGEYVLVRMRDTGCGMDKDVLEHVFEPFFTTKEVGKGTGLGLATVYGIVKQNDGYIDVRSEPGRGTEIEIYFPRTTAAAAEVPAAEEQEPKSGAETVLLVEDEQAILKLGEAILKRYGYRVLTAAAPSEAVTLAERHEGPIHLLLTDVVMPGMNGNDLRNRIAGLRPDIKTLFMSGYTAEVIARQGMLPEGVRYLQKPFSVKALASKVREVLDEK